MAQTLLYIYLSYGLQSFSTLPNYCCVYVAVIKPTIDIMCDPDFINETLYNWLEYRERLAREHKHSYSYAATYEQFMDIIEKCSDLEHLKQLRYNIITEIVHATAIQHFKRQKGEDTGTYMSRLISISCTRGARTLARTPIYHVKRQL